MAASPAHAGRNIRDTGETTARPQKGPRILFFSGGTALKATARELCRRSYNCIHLVTPFDSGGSSAALRHAFHMPAVGDARSRLMSLADTSLPGNEEVYTLLTYRLPQQETQKRLHKELAELLKGAHPLLRQVPCPMKSVILEHLSLFASHMPEDFPLAGASIGNLVLAAGYLRENRRLWPAIAMLSRMVKARGLVRTTVEEPAHLAVRLESGAVLVGQHRFTGKETGGVPSPIADIWLAAHEDSPEPAQVAVRPCTAKLIRRADAICYPVGSFYSSVVANLLPSGVGRAVAGNAGPKVFVPNLGRDPELAGHTLCTQLERLVRPLLADSPGAAIRDVLSHILVDMENGAYPGGIPYDFLAAHGIVLENAPLVRQGAGPLADPRLLSEALFRLIRPAAAWSAAEDRPA